MSKDEVFRDARGNPGSFRFDESVASVFPDMLRRSIPGYEATIEAIGILARRHVTAASRCYDLGCSLGEASWAMRNGIAVDGCEIHAIDNSPAMVERCRERAAAGGTRTPVIVTEADLREIDVINASMVVMNYTLQFLPVTDRLDVIRGIRDGMTDDGVFILSEKVAEEDPVLDTLIVDLHLDFKRANAYSELEISRKRSALENVLVPEPVSVHLERLRQAGFSHAGIWMKHFNFVSFVALP
jgi:tRNA (cmo5U34)-methyltransferase